MPVSPNTLSRRLGAILATVLLAVTAFSVTAAVKPAGADARRAPIGLADARAVGKSGTCSRLASRKARAAAARARARGARPARVARRVRRAVRRRCLRGQRHTKATASTEVGGALAVGVDGGYAGWSESEIGQRTDLGAPVTRHEWDPSQPVDEQDDVVEVAAGEIHTRIHALLGGNQLGDPSHYRDWVVAFVRRYGIGGSFWASHPELDESRFAITTIELGNEPYFGEMSASLYADTVRPALEEIKRLSLPVQVALASRVYGSNTSWMDTLYERIPNLNELFDAFADHPYWYGHDPGEGTAAGPFARISTLRARMNERGANTKAIWITEYGESTAGCGGECVSEATQASHLKTMLEGAAGNADWGIRMLLFYQLRDRGSASGERELEFGLLRQDGAPKPVYAAVRGAMQQYAG